MELSLLMPVPVPVLPGSMPPPAALPRGDGFAALLAAFLAPGAAMAAEPGIVDGETVSADTTPAEPALGEPAGNATAVAALPSPIPPEGCTAPPPPMTTTTTPIQPLLVVPAAVSPAGQAVPLSSQANTASPVVPEPARGPDGAAPSVAPPSSGPAATAPARMPAPSTFDAMPRLEAPPGVPAEPALQPGAAPQPARPAMADRQAMPNAPAAPTAPGAPEAIPAPLPPAGDQAAMRKANAEGAPAVVAEPPAMAARAPVPLPRPARAAPAATTTPADAPNPPTLAAAAVPRPSPGMALPQASIEAPPEGIEVQPVLGATPSVIAMPAAGIEASVAPAAEAAGPAATGESAMAPVAQPTAPREAPAASIPPPRDALPQAASAEAAASPRPPPVALPVRQVVPFAVALAFGPDARLELTLDPVELGRVEVAIERQGGEALVSLRAERPETLALLQRDRAELERALSDAGLRGSDGGGPSLSFGHGGDGAARQERRSPGGQRHAPSQANTEAPARETASRGLIDLAL